MATEKSIKAYWERNGDNFERYYKKPEGIIGRIIHSFLNQRASRIISLLPIKPGDKILDLGCGSGHFLVNLTSPEAKIIGIDYSFPLLKLAEKNLRNAKARDYNLILGDVYRIPAVKSRFDIVICSGVLDYVLDVRCVLDEIHRVLKGSGVAIVTIPKKPSPFFIFRFKLGVHLRKLLFGLPPILTSMTKSEIRKITDDAGFKVENITEIFQTMWICRIKPNNQACL